MKNPFLILFSFAAIVGIPCAKAALPSDQVVVLISVDGLAHFYLDDPKAEMPMIRELIAGGASAAKMKSVFPSVTWPVHTTLVTGVLPNKHGVFGNTYIDRASGKVIELSGDPLFDKEQIVKAPTLYDVAKEAGLKTAAIAWPATRSAKTLDWTVPFVLTNELFQRHGTPSLWGEFKQAGIAYETEAEGYKPGKGEARDILNMQMFNHVLHAHRPQLALFHILEVDHIQHVNGPKSAEAYAAIKFADSCVRRIWEQLNRDFPGKATLIVVSDHGFFPYQQTIQANVILRKAGLLKVNAGRKIAAAQVRSVYQGGSTFIYVLDATQRDAMSAQVAALFAGVEGVEQVITPKEFSKYGLPTTESDPQMPDLILSARSGYAFSDAIIGDIDVMPKSSVTKGMHGYDPNYDELHGIFVAWGAGIKAGTKIGPINCTDVTPTMAKLLGLEMNNLDGQVLDSILVK